MTQYVSDSMDMSLSKLSGDGEGQGSLGCSIPWDRKESATTELTKHIYTQILKQIFHKIVHILVMYHAL